VIGSTLEALCYSYLNNAPIFFTRMEKPWLLESFNSELDLSCFNFKNEKRIIISNQREAVIGSNKFSLWDYLYFCINLSGLCPTSDKLQSIRIEENSLKAHTSNARMMKATFEEAIIFDDHELYGLDFTENKQENKLIEVRDWFNVRSGMKHQFDLLENEEDFVKKILFYPSERIDGNSPYKDAVSISYLTEEQIQDFEYSEINARFKTLYEMKSAGIRGARNGRDQNNPEKYKFYAVKIENRKRQIIRNKKNYNSYGIYKFNYDSICDIMKQHQSSDSYVRRLSKQIC
jgi:hypothetical protein